MQAHGLFNSNERLGPSFEKSMQLIRQFRQALANLKKLDFSKPDTLYPDAFFKMTLNRPDRFLPEFFSTAWRELLLLLAGELQGLSRNHIGFEYLIIENKESKEKTFTIRAELMTLIDFLSNLSLFFLQGMQLSDVDQHIALRESYTKKYNLLIVQEVFKRRIAEFKNFFLVDPRSLPHAVLSERFKKENIFTDDSAELLKIWDAVGNAIHRARFGSKDAYNATNEVWEAVDALVSITNDFFATQKLDLDKYQEINVVLSNKLDLSLTPVFRFK